MKRKWERQRKRKLNYRCRVITCYIPEIYIEYIDDIIVDKLRTYPSRSEAIRNFIRLGLMLEFNIINRLIPEEDGEEDREVVVKGDKVIINGKEMKLLGEA